MSALDTGIRGIALLAVAAGLLAPSSVSADYYRGEDHGIEIEMRIRGDRIVFARVATTIYCTPRPIQPGGERHPEAMRFYVGARPRDATHSDSGSVRVGRRGGFRERIESSPLEEDGFEELVFGGRVSRRFVRGHFRYRSHYDEDCRTGGFPAADESDRGGGMLRFVARRGSSAESHA